MTYDELIKIGAVNSNAPRFKSKLQKSIDVCREQLATHNAPYVALSGGKDSVAMAYIVDAAARLENKDFRLWSHISDASFPGTLETVKAVANGIKRPLDIYESKVSAFEYFKKSKAQDFGKKGVFFDSVKEYATDKDLCFVGVRAAESKRRMQAGIAHGMTYHSKSMGDVDIVNPLQWFSIYDVFSVLHMYSAPVHPIYKKFPTQPGENANGEPYFIRLGYITAKDLMDKGTILFIKANYPDIYAKFAAAFPEIKVYS